MVTNQRVRKQKIGNKDAIIPFKTVYFKTSHILVRTKHSFNVHMIV